MDKRLLYAASAAAASIVVSVIIVRTYIYSFQPTPRITPVSLTPLSRISASLLASRDAMAQRLAAALRFRTISYEDSEGNAASLLEDIDAIPKKSCGGCVCCKNDDASSSSSSEKKDACTSPTPEALSESRCAFLALHRHLETSFPNLHATLERHIINKYSLIYIWRPSNIEFSTRAAVALAAHLDVVPVPDAAEWLHAPFDGVISNDGFIHGRGAIDDKHSLLTICEAVEALIIAGVKPTRPIILTFGHDEELGGMDGAAAIAQNLPLLLKDCKADRPLSFLLDEGLFLLRELFPGVSRRVALVCTREKGHVNVELKVTAPAGHSSVPPSSSSIGTLAKAICAIEVESTRAPLFNEPAFSLLRALAPDLPLPIRVLVANSWLFAPLLRSALLASSKTAALLRSTTAVTMTSGGLKSNVLPPFATALINHRVHPNESVADVVARDQAAVGPLISCRPFEELEPAPVAQSDGAIGWESVRDALTVVYPDATIAQGLMLGNTDTRHFWKLADNIYRHCPVSLTVNETAMFHGKNEKISIDQLPLLASFYAAVLLGSACGGL